MRVYVLYVVLAAVALYAFRDWFLTLCGLIVLTALMGHPDMPRTMLGITGLNPWNLLFGAVVVSWLVHGRHQPGRVPLPPWAKKVFVAYVAMIVIAVARALIDIDSFQVGPGVPRMTWSALINDQLINGLKFLAPGFLLYDGCRSRRRTIQALLAVLCMSVAYGFVVVRTVPVSGLQQTGKAEMRQRRRIGKRVGFHANSAAMIAVSGFWGIVALGRLGRRKWHVLALVAAGLIVGLGLLSTRSRAGYLAFIGVGLVMGVFVWRYLLIILPVMIIAVCIAFPGVVERISSGFGVETVSGSTTENMDEVTAGRTTVLWPPVIEQIAATPVLGMGRFSLLRGSAFGKIVSSEGSCPTHPHNAYFEVMLDSGIFGLIIVLTLYAMIARVSVALCWDRSDPIFVAVGGASLAAVCAILIMGLSGQSFFPKENMQMQWCLWLLALRVWEERRRRMAARSVADAIPIGAVA